MNEPQNEEKQYKLTDLVVNSIGLVRRGANRKPFMFVKSADGTQGEDMENENDTQVVETPTADELEEFRAWKAAQANEPAATLEETVDFADLLAQQEKRLTEQFAVKLEKERERSEKLAEAFAEEKRKRRLMEYTDQAATFSNLPVAAEQFGEDLMVLADNLPQEVYTRLVETLRASDEAVAKGNLFSQFAQPVRDEHGDPFIGKVTQLQKQVMEADMRKTEPEAFAEAFTKAEELYPDLAKAYSIRQMGGA